MNKTETLAECQATCKGVKGCAGVVFAEPSCAGAQGPICWLKSDCNPQVRARWRRGGGGFNKEKQGGGVGGGGTKGERGIGGGN